jgi:alkylation response protein AidB-like acyl-CoA dehydrogenase
MRFAFTDDQRLFAETVREVLSKSCPPEAVRAAGTDPRARRGKAWRALAEIGLLGAHVPEEYGGLGLGPVDTVLAQEELGRAAVPGPIVETAVAAPILVGSEWLPKIAAGAAAVSVAMPHLLDADLADLLVIPSDRSMEITSPEFIPLTPSPSTDPSRRLFAPRDLAIDIDTSCKITAAERRVATYLPGYSRAFDHAALAVAAQLIGLGRHLLDTTVAYAKQRRQFGRQIGSFQAVKHHLADVAIAVEFAAPMVYRAAAALTEEVPTASRDVSAAKVMAGKAAYRAARTALQVHGAIGYTDELDLHLWLTRVWALRTAWGDDRLHRARLRTALLSDEGAVRWP